MSDKHDSSKIPQARCVFYIYNVILFSLSVKQHLSDVDEILQVLGDAGVSLKFEKCTFFAYTMRHLGHIIRPGRLQIY